MSRLLLAVVALLLSHPLQAAEPDWSAYRQLLQDHVRSGELEGVKLTVVDYPAWQNNPLWPQVVEQLNTYPADQLQTRAEKLAFYINAYNILAIKMVLDNWPLDGIRDAGSLLFPVWRKDVGQLHGKTVTLQQVEDDMIRSLNEPRIHMAIVCASVSCPDLRPEPYTAAQLEQQLEEQTRAFLHNDAKGVRINGNDVEVSKIFDWFEKDFADAGGVKAFIERYRPLPAQSSIDDYLDYNWNLNRQ